VAGISPLKVFIIFGIVSTWAAQALEDGRITLIEAADLGTQLGALLGIPVDVRIPRIPELIPEPDESTEHESTPDQDQDERSPPGSAHTRFAPSLHT